MARTPPPRKKSWRDRPTAELIVLGLTAMVCFVITVEVIGLIVFAFITPKDGVVGAAGKINDVISMVLALIVGYLAGQNTGSKKDEGPQDGQ